ncbi:MAG TPA: heavy metal-associated domain-containing protein [Fimbriimonadaceae bacterium]|nr:heavy metal-associated domain-containing protein [Fimbriimonadaceae bacterium]
MSVVAKTFFCPDLVSQADETSILEALQDLPGIESVEADRVAHTVFVSIANSNGMQAVEEALRDAGFPPEE